MVDSPNTRSRTAIKNSNSDSPFPFNEKVYGKVSGKGNIRDQIMFRPISAPHHSTPQTKRRNDKMETSPGKSSAANIHKKLDFRQKELDQTSQTEATDTKNASTIEASSSDEELGDTA